jgi:hypothetical protein
MDAVLARPSVARFVREASDEPHAIEAYDAV